MWTEFLLTHSLTALGQVILAIPEAFGRSGLLLAALATLLFLETRSGQDSRGPAARASYCTNLGAMVVNDTLMSLLPLSSLWWVASQAASWQLLPQLVNPCRFAITIILLDLTLYLWHRACHTLPWLWWFHRVHHSDPYINATTAFRLHFLELACVCLVKAAFIWATGVELPLMLAADAVIVVWVMVIHARLSLPAERWLGMLLIVPTFHRLHHSVQRSKHDHNYGFLLSLWDRWFATLAIGNPMRVGLDGVATEGWRALLLPGHSKNVLIGSLPVSLDQQIAEAAYFRALNRGFAPGFELEDWLEAERQLGLAGEQQRVI